MTDQKLGAVDGCGVMRDVQKLGIVWWEDDDNVALVPLDGVILAITSPRNRLPIQPVEKIEAAIEKLDGCPGIKSLELADLLRWVLGQPQDTWIDEDFGLPQEGEKNP
jgi:hypothetical protein